MSAHQQASHQQLEQQEQQQQMLDSEKHTASFSDLQDLTRTLNDTTINVDDDYEEEDEFGGSGLKDEPDRSFLQAMETEYDDLAQSISKIPPITPSQLQAHLAVGLDKEKHDDLADLSLHQLQSNGSVDLMDQSTDDEFGCAHEDDQAVEQYLETSMTNVHGEPQQSQQLQQSQQQQPVEAISLDREKHDELGPMLFETPKAALDVSDQPEFGYAHANDQAVDDYLQQSKDAIRREHVRRGDSRVMVTPSQLQARIPAALDDDKHDEIGGLMMAKLDPDNDEDEFGDADLGDQAVQQYLQKSRESIHRQNGDRGMGGLQVTPSQLQALIASALDDEKHEEMGDILTPAGLMRVVDVEENIDDDDEEFGGAAADDTPVNQYLQRARASMMEDDDIGPLFNDGEDGIDDDDAAADRVGPTSTKTSADKVGLDGEQHDEIGELMRSPKPRSLSMDTTDEDGDDEFGSAGASELPVGHYLRLNQESVDEEDDNKLRPPPKVTKSQLQAMIPSGLDGEEHEDISALLAQSRHGSLDDHDDDWNEFGDATTTDTPVHKYLRRSSESLPLVSDDAEEDDIDDKGGDHIDPNHRRQLLLAQAKKTLLMEDGRHASMVEELEEDDMDDDIIEYEELKGGSFSQLVVPAAPPSDYTNKKWLDADRHEDLGDLRKSNHSDLDDDDNVDGADGGGDDEFGVAGEDDAPVQTYLMSQNSMHDRSYDFDHVVEEGVTTSAGIAADTTSVQQQ
eukprot:Nitzschia sp. Nitz4//NODE_367_length_23738_cov_71.755985//5294//7507//NITZ4_additional_000042-RA//-1//CDS//3329531849//8259//frame0